MVKYKIIIISIFVVVNSLFGVTDMLGRNVEIKSSEKLVFLGPGALRLGIYLGLEDKIVGIERTEKKDAHLLPYRQIIHEKGLLKLPIVAQGGPGKAPSLEALIQSGATLIISSLLSVEQIDLIEKKTKIPVVSISYYDKGEKKIQSMKDSLLLIGKITNKSSRAKELVKWMSDEEKKLKALKIDRSKKLYIGGLSYKGSWGITSSESDYVPFKIMGLENSLKAKKNGHLFLDLERIVEVNPDIIFLDKSGSVTIKEEQKTKKDVLSSLKAFKNNDVYWLIPFNYYNTNIENCFIIAWNIAKILGEDVDMKMQENRIYKVFFGKK